MRGLFFCTKLLFITSAVAQQSNMTIIALFLMEWLGVCLFRWKCLVKIVVNVIKYKEWGGKLCCAADLGGF